MEQNKYILGDGTAVTEKVREDVKYLKKVRMEVGEGRR